MAAQLVLVESVKNIAEELIKLVLEEKCIRGETGEQPYLTHEAVRWVQVKIHNRDAQDSVWTLYKDYLWNSEIAGLKSIFYIDPHVSIPSIWLSIKQFYLKLKKKNMKLWETTKISADKTFWRLSERVS